ncbi:CDP-glycerol glycerophosphotransferase family protein [Nocardioides sp. WV_118_6]
MRRLSRVLAPGDLAGRVVRRARRVADHLRLVVVMRIRQRTPLDQAVLYGLNDDEENLLCAALGWADRYGGSTTLLAADPPRVRALLAVEAALLGTPGLADRVEVRTRTRRTLVRLHGRSRYVLTSHVVLAAPRARAPRTHVHLGHGLGPKTYRNVRSSESGFLSAARVWDPAHRRAMRLDPAAARFSGFPRDQVLYPPRTPADDHALRRLGIDPDRPFVLWMPTFRRTRIGGSVWAEGRALTDLTTELAGSARAAPAPGPVPAPAPTALRPAARPPTPTALRPAARHHGVQLVVKPHPVEHDALTGLADLTLTNPAIWAAGISPYRLIGLADGLLTDYSSVAVEVLPLQRSLAFYCPDLDEFEHGVRGLCPPDYRALVGRLLLDDAAALDAFFRAVAGGQRFRPVAAGRFTQVVGSTASAQAAAGALDEVVRHALDRAPDPLLRPR